MAKKKVAWLSTEHVWLQVSPAPLRSVPAHSPRTHSSLAALRQSKQRLVRRLTFLHGVPSFRQGRRSRSTAAAVAVLRGGAPAVAAVRAAARNERRGGGRRVPRGHPLRRVARELLPPQLRRPPRVPRVPNRHLRQGSSSLSALTPWALPLLS
jgi:hypothetical protein